MTLSPAPKPFLQSLIRAIPDYPKPGIVFRDITPLLADPLGFGVAVDLMERDIRRECPIPVEQDPLPKIVACEARGFIIGAALATCLGVGFIPLRKKGKLPHVTIGRDYALEYGTDRIEMHADAIQPGDQVILVDDLLATGGTALAAIELLEEAGAKVLLAAFLIELPDLGGRARIEARGTPIYATLSY